MEKIYIVIPAYNEAPVIAAVIAEVRKSGYADIIVVDDGSCDATAKNAKDAGVITLVHILNRGKGAAVKTGIEAAKILGADIVITLDGDGQHNPDDIHIMLEKIHEGFDVVLGSRLYKPKGMPSYKIVANHIGNMIVYLLYGLWVTDSQSGFRAYSKKAFTMINTRTDRYEYDSEVIYEIKKNKLCFTEIPIEVRYTAYSMGKQHKMNLKNGIKTFLKMLLS